MKLIIKKIDKLAKGLLNHATTGDAGLDICSNEDVVLIQNIPTKIGTGVAVELPIDKVGLIWDKSSIGSKGIKTLGGVIDSGYRGEIFVTLINLTSENIKIDKGQKIANFIIQDYTNVEELIETEEISDSERGAGGFGSTGK
ncbi:MAG: dUTP diphosphatase [Candidatus Nomurabacteria bacterium]